MSARGALLRRHRPEEVAAAYLDGLLDVASRREVDEHLLRCEQCWAEVDAARRGRSLAESARETAPAALRERLRAVVEAGGVEDGHPAPVGGTGGTAAATTRPHPAPPRRRLVLAAAAALVVGASAAALVVGLRAADDVDPLVVAAVAGVRDDRLPGPALPGQQAPDLRALSLVPVGGGRGEPTGEPLTAWAYEDPQGREVVVHLAEAPFARPPAAQDLPGSDGWSAADGELTLVCVEVPQDLLVVGADAGLVREAAEELTARAV